MHLLMTITIRWGWILPTHGTETVEPGQWGNFLMVSGDLTR